MKESKTFRLVLVALLITTIHCVGQSPIYDTVCIPRNDVVKLLTKAEEGKLLGQKVTVLQNEIQILNRRILLKEETIKAHEQKDTNNDSLINNYKQEISIMKDQRKIFEDEITHLNKEIKRYKRRLFWRTAAAGTIITGTAILYFTK